jgi:hypothetical protein
MLPGLGAPLQPNVGGGAAMLPGPGGAPLQPNVGGGAAMLPGPGGAHLHQNVGVGAAMLAAPGGAPALPPVQGHFDIDGGLEGPPLVPRSDAGRKRSDRIDQRRNKRPRYRPQKDTVLRSQRLHRLQPRLLDRGKKDAMAAASKEIDTAAPGVHLRSSPLGVLDLKHWQEVSNWSPEEKARFLGLKEVAVWAVEGKDWDYISKGMTEYGFDRTPKNCENQWGTLLKSYRAREESAIEEHESSTGTDTRSRNKLPPELYEGMERILLAQEAKRSKRKSRGIAVPESRGDEDDDLYTNSGLLQPGEAPERGVTDCAETPCLEFSDREGSRAILEEAPHLVIDAHASPSIERKIKAAVSSKLEMLQRSCSTPEQKELLTALAPLGAKQANIAVDTELKIREFVHGKSGPSRTGLADVMECINDALEVSFQPLVSALQAFAQREEEGRKRLGARENDGSLKRRDLDLEEEKKIGTLPGGGADQTPLKQRIEAALEPVVGGIASVLKSQAEEARKQRELFLALEEEKLALKRAKIRRLKRRCAGRLQPSRRASSAKPLRPRKGRGHRLRLL